MSGIHWHALTVGITSSMILDTICRDVIGVRIDATDYDSATEVVVDWARTGDSRYVCAANVHMVMEAYDDDCFRKILNQADLITPDGMPLVWSLKLLGLSGATRVYGPDLTLCICREAARACIPIGFYGGTEESLKTFVEFLNASFPGICIPCCIAPPYRPLTLDEDAEYVRQIKRSGVKILFVGIGCPKQERWMALHKGVIPVVMIGVGAAFDFLSGRIRQAPGWMQRIGMEWLFRLMMEPRRLWKRYFRHNPRFIALFAQQWLLRKSELSYSPSVHHSAKTRITPVRQIKLISRY